MKILTIITCLVGLLLLSTTLPAQCLSQGKVTFSDLPANFQLYPRNVQDEAIVKIAGTVTDPNIDQMCVTVYSRTEGGSNQLFEAQQCQSIGTGQSNFDFDITILAALQEYRFEIVAWNNGNFVCSEARDWVVAGDVFVLAGQSNATSGGCTQNCSQYDKPYFGRSFGHFTQALSNFTPPYNPAGEAWGRADCQWGGDNWAGYIGMELMNRIQDNQGIPVCLINGAVAGQTILNLLPSQTPSNPANLNLSNNYDIFYHKCVQAGITNAVKGILWYQGESDMSRYNDYPGDFTSLYQAWEADFPSLERVYVYQLHPYGTHNATDADRFRDMQRTFPYLFPKVRLMATCGIGEDDHTCITWNGTFDAGHYDFSGDVALANLMYPLIERDFYCGASLVDTDITSPNIQWIERGSVFFSRSNGWETTYTLHFDQDISIQESMVVWGTTRYLRDAFFDGSRLHINVYDFIVSGNKLYLKVDLGSPFAPSKITYLPRGVYDTDEMPYEGPWIWNAAQTVGALSFWEVGANVTRKAGAATYSENVTDNWPAGCEPDGFDPGLVCGQPQDGAEINAAVIRNCHGCSGSYNEILSGRNVEYKAVYKVKLRPGFHAKSGSQFLAHLTEIRNCGPLPSFKAAPRTSPLEAEEAQVIPVTPELQETMELFPNPAQGATNIRFPNQNRAWTLEIIDVQGQVLKKLNYEDSAVSVSLEGLPGGIYLIRGTDIDGQSHLKKLLVQ